MAFTREELLENNLMSPVVPPVNPDEGLVQLAMAKGSKGKVPFMREPTFKPDPILELDIDIPLQLEKGKSLEEMQSERLNLQTETDVLAKDKKAMEKDPAVIEGPQEFKDYRNINDISSLRGDFSCVLGPRVTSLELCTGFNYCHFYSP